jgi:PAS domain-containing protein
LKAWITPHLVQSLSEVIDSALELTGADFGDIQLLDAKGRLRIVAQRHFPAWWLAYWEGEMDVSGAASTALQLGERVIVEDVEMSPVYVGTPALDMQRRAGIRAVQSTPLRDKSGQWLGVFSSHWRTPHYPDAKTLKVLDLLAVQIASLVENAHAELALRASENLLRLALEAAHAGTWKLNLATWEMTASERTLQLHNVPPGTSVTHALALSYLYPEDRERIDAAIRHTAETGEPFQTELRVPMPDGSVRWVASIAERMEEQGQPCIIGLVQEITERKRLQEQLVASESRYRLVVQDQMDVISRLDRKSTRLNSSHNPASRMPSSA